MFNFTRLLTILSLCRCFKQRLHGDLKVNLTGGVQLAMFWYGQYLLFSHVTLIKYTYLLTYLLLNKNIFFWFIFSSNITLWIGKSNLQEIILKTLISYCSCLGSHKMLRNPLSLSQLSSTPDKNARDNMHAHTKVPNSKFSSHWQTQNTRDNIQYTQTQKYQNSNTQPYQWKIMSYFIRVKCKWVLRYFVHIIEY